MKRHLFAGADFAFRRDSSALCVVERTDDTYAPILLEELRPKRGAPLRPSAVCGHFAELLNDFAITEVFADVHERENLKERLQEHGVRLKDAPAGEAGKLETYSLLRTLLYESRLRIPEHPRLVAQLKQLVAKPISGGKIRIDSPRRGAGAGHGDLVSALTVALWRAHDRRREGGPATYHGPVTPRVHEFWGDAGAPNIWGDEPRGFDSINRAALPTIARGIR